jgi:hypothetical protein
LSRFRPQARPRRRAASHQERKPWLPAIGPPNRKPEALKRFLDEMSRRDEIAREMMRPDVSDLKAWLAEANI